MAVRRHLDGTHKMYRDRTEMEARWASQGGKPDSSQWFRKGGTTGVLMVPSTKGGVLKLRVEEVMK